MDAFVVKKTEKKYQPGNPIQVDLNDRLATWIAKSMLPLSFVEDQGFHHFMELALPRYQIPCRKTLTNQLLQGQQAKLLFDVKKKLGDLESVSLTLDLWSNRQMKSFMGVTAHFIDKKWQMNSLMLRCRRFKGSHTADRIYDEYDDCVSEFSISKKICHILTDNGANVKKAFSLPSFEQFRAEHEDYIDENDSWSDTEQPLEHLPENISCVAHTTNLVVKDGFKNADRLLMKALAKAAGQVNHCRNSTVATDRLDGIRLQAKNATRWNSQYTMIESVLKVDANLLNSLCPDYKINGEERDALKDMCAILSHFKIFTDLIQADKSVTSSLVHPYVQALLHNLSAMESDRKINIKFLRGLIHSVKTRLLPYTENTTLKLATFLDPRFKADMFLAAVKEDVLVTIRKSASVHTRQEDDIIHSPPPKRSKFLGGLQSSLNSGGSSVTAVPKVRINSVDKELDSYLCEISVDEDSNPLEWWCARSGNFPILSTMAKKYLSMPATSAPVERLFSIAGKIFRPERSSLSDGVFEMLMFIRCNGTYNE